MVFREHFCENVNWKMFFDHNKKWWFFWSKAKVWNNYIINRTLSDAVRIYLREALLTFVGAAKLMFPFVRSFVRSSVRPENNWFLSRVYEPTTRAPVYWDFEIMILKAPEKTSHNVKLRLKGDTLGDQFLNTFGCFFFLQDPPNS